MLSGLPVTTSEKAAPFSPEACNVSVFSPQATRMSAARAAHARSRTARNTLGASLTVRILPSSQRKNTRMCLPKIEPQGFRASRERLVRHDDLQLGAGRTDRA